MVRRAFSFPAVWAVGFGAWALILSGLPALWVGPPGAIQSVSLQRLLDAKQRQIASLQDTLERLETDADLLRKNRSIQQREIRRVLGYASPDEIIFDFNAESDGGL